MRPFLIAGLSSLATLAACSSASHVPDQALPQPQTVAISGVSGSLKISSNASSSTSAVNAPVDQVWKVLPIVFDSAGIPISTMEPAKRLIGNEGFKIRQRLAKTSLSRYLDCGTTQIGPNADSYEVVITVYVQLSSASATSTNVTTSLDASARPVAFNQAYNSCSSKGVLETRLLDLIRANLPH